MGSCEPGKDRLYFTFGGKSLEGHQCSLINRFSKSQSCQGFSILVVEFPVCGKCVSQGGGVVGFTYMGEATKLGLRVQVFSCVYCNQVEHLAG